MFKVQALVWAIRTPAGHPIYAWWEQITQYFFFLFESWKSQTQECSYKFVKFKFHVKREEGKKDQDKVRSLQLLSHSCSASSASYGFLRIFFFFVVSSLQRKDWTMNASSAVSHSTHQRSFNATWLSTALRAWVEPSSARSALQVRIVHVSVCMQACVYRAVSAQWTHGKIIN